MSVNVYTIEDLLIGQTYRSRSITGEIVSAEKHPDCLHYDGAEPYRVQVRTPNGNYTYRALAVKVDQIVSAP